MKSPRPNMTLVQVFLAEIGRKGGKAKSKAKAKAAKANGKLGGRPPKAKKRPPSGSNDQGMGRRGAAPTSSDG